MEPLEIRQQAVWNKG